jgi:shikimate kinase
VRKDKIYLVGFVSAGKTTLARALGPRLGWRVEDVDERIEAAEQQTVTEIFASRGEFYFRSVEREVLYQLLPARHLVVATGAGTFVDQDCRAAINRDGVSVWLDVPFERLVDRLPADSRRPLAASRGEMEQLYVARRRAYQQAHLRLDAGAAPVGELVERVLDWLGF